MESNRRLVCSGRLTTLVDKSALKYPSHDLLPREKVSNQADPFLPRLADSFLPPSENKIAAEMCLWVSVLPFGSHPECFRSSDFHNEDRLVGLRSSYIC